MPGLSCYKIKYASNTKCFALIKKIREGLEVWVCPIIAVPHFQPARPSLKSDAKLSPSKSLHGGMPEDAIKWHKEKLKWPIDIVSWDKSKFMLFKGCARP